MQVWHLDTLLVVRELLNSIVLESFSNLSDYISLRPLQPNTYLSPPPETSQP